jgi:hypothetical protein
MSKDLVEEYVIEKSKAKASNLPHDTFITKGGGVSVDVDPLDEKGMLGPEAPAAAPDPAAEESAGMMQQATDFLAGAGRAIVGGFRDVGQGAIDVGADVGDTIREAGVPLPSFNTERGEFLSAEETLEVRAANRALGDDAVPTLPDFEEKGGGVEAFARGTIAFFAPFIASGGLKGITVAGRLAHSTGAGAVADLLFAPEDGTMIFMLKEFEKGFGTDITPDIFDFFDSKSEDTATGKERLKQRILQATEGAILGVVIDGMIEAFTFMKQNPELRERALEAFKDFAADESGAVKAGNALGVGTKQIDDALGEFPPVDQNLVPGQTTDEILESAWLAQESGQTGVKGSTNVLDDAPLTYNEKPIQQWSPADFEAVGDEVGIERLGPASEPAPVKLDDGRTVNIPGGLDGQFTYYDMLTIKSQGIDASLIPEATHAQLQKKMSRSLKLDELSDDQVWSGLAFGMTSPNNPLFPNQLAMSRLRGASAVDELADSITWKYGDEVDPATRAAADKEIAAKFGLNAGDAGGLGVRGTQNYTRVAELAQLFKENPEFFQREAGEAWPEFSERVFSQVSGLRAKTGSFSVVFQDPLEAGVSAIDRHMARLFMDKILVTPKDRMAWQKRAINLYNKRNKLKGKNRVRSMGALNDGFIGEMILSEVGKTSSPKFRLADGSVNPNVPEKLQNTDWIKEPQNVELMGSQYKAALQANQEQAMKHGLGIFSSQWMLWDRMRRRLEPHENMFPGLEKLPRPDIDQARQTSEAHRDAGHKDFTKEVVDEEAGEFRLRPTKPVDNPAKLAYFAFPLALMSMSQGEDK